MEDRDNPNLNNFSHTFNSNYCIESFIWRVQEWKTNIKFTNTITKNDSFDTNNINILDIISQWWIILC